MSGVCEKPSAADIPIEVGGSLTWQKLSPAEFQQLQDYMACKYFNNKIYSRSSMYRRLQMNSSYIIAKFKMECDRVLRVALFIHEIHSNPTSSK